MKLNLKNILFIISFNFLFAISTLGQSTQSSSVRITIKLIKHSEDHVNGENRKFNEVFLNRGNIEESEDFPRDLVLTFSNRSLNEVGQRESIMIERGSNSKKISVGYNEQFAMRNVKKNEKIKFNPPRFNSASNKNNPSIITIAY